ncbi:acyl carrier protein [Dactylosporangium sp. NPDC000521]|uniref:acyl carrier protein n=1 Tax=Dactylosporangium sp. NPDC000521 TaxID=3363975 RepID=UPI0036AAA0A1
MMQAIEARITEILVEDFKVDAGALRPGATFADLNFDSLVLVELILVLGNQFRVPLDDGALHDTMTVTDAAGVLAARGAVA